MESKADRRLKIQLLILRAQAGSESGFRDLFDMFKGLTCSYLNQLFNEIDRDDVQQQVWLKVYQQLPKLNSPYGFKRWLLQITHSVAFDHLKQSNRHYEVFTDNCIESEQIIDEKLMSELHDNFDSLHAAINKLSFEHKEVVLLFYWQDFNCSDIAQILSCSVGTVKSRLFSARQYLSKFKLLNEHSMEIQNG